MEDSDFLGWPYATKEFNVLAIFNRPLLDHPYQMIKYIF
jgi:hypothetical protein